MPGVLPSGAARNGARVSVAPYVRAAKAVPTDGLRKTCYLRALIGEDTRKVEPSAALRCGGQPTRHRVKSLALERTDG